MIPSHFFPHLADDEAVQYYVQRAKQAKDLLLIYTDVQMSGGAYELHLFREVADFQLGFADGSSDGWGPASYTFLVPSREYAEWLWHRTFLGITGISDPEFIYETMPVDKAVERIKTLEESGQLRIFSTKAINTLFPLLIFDPFSTRCEGMVPFSDGELLRFVALPPAYAIRAASILHDLLRNVGAEDSPFELVRFSDFEEDIADEARRLKAALS